MTYVPQWTPTGSNNANQIVEDKFNATKDYADSAFNDALTALKELENFAKTIKDVNTKVTLGMDKSELYAPPDLTSYLKDVPPDPLTDADYKAITDAIPKSNIFSYSEDTPPDFSTLLSTLQTNLTSVIVSGGVGLISASLEDAIFQREKTRDRLTNEDTKAKVSAEWAKRRFPMPGAGFFQMAAQVDIEYQNKLLDKSRAIAEESRKIEIQNMQFSYTTADSVLGKIMTYKDKYWDRKLQSAKVMVDVAIEIMKATVEGLKAKAEVYATEMQGVVAYLSAVAKITDIEVAAIRAKVDWAVADSNVKIANVKAELEQAIEKYKLADSELKAVVQMSTQLAASALAAISAAAHIQQSVSTSVGAQIQSQESWNHNLDTA